MTPVRTCRRHATALRCGRWLFALLAQRTPTGLRLSPIADFSFLTDVARGRD